MTGARTSEPRREAEAASVDAPDVRHFSLPGSFAVSPESGKQMNR